MRIFRYDRKQSIKRQSVAKAGRKISNVNLRRKLRESVDKSESWKDMKTIEAHRIYLKCLNDFKMKLFGCNSEHSAQL